MAPRFVILLGLLIAGAFCGPAALRAQTSDLEGGGTELVQVDLAQARAAVESAEWDEALKLLNGIIRNDRENLEAYYWRGITYREREKSYTLLSNALADFEYVTERDSLFRDVLYQYALTLSSRRQYPRDHTEAIALAERQLQLKPELHDVQLGIFGLYRDLMQRIRRSSRLDWLRDHDSPHARIFEAEMLRDEGEFMEADRILADLMLPPAPGGLTVPLQPLLLARAQVYYGMGKPERGQAFVVEAVDRIDGKLAADFLYEDFKYVLDLEELQRYQEIGTPDEYREFFAKLWIKRDPLPAAPVNVRLAEHFRRMGVAVHEYFASDFRKPTDPAFGLNLPPTHDFALELEDRGMIFVRHGEPDGREWTGITDTWSYFDPWLTFLFAVDSVTPGSPNLPDGNSMPPIYGVLMRLRGGTTWAGMTTDRHSWPEETIPLDLPHLLAAFRGPEGQTLLDLFYALPTGEISLAATTENTVSVEVGLAFHDLDWNPVGSFNETKRLIAVAEQNAGGMDFFRVLVRPDSYHVAVHARSLSTPHIGAYQFDERVPDFSTQELQMSSLLPAFRIEPARPGSRLNRGDLYVEVNPFRTFSAAQPVNVYFEVYNLTYGADDLTRYSVEYTLRSVPEDGGILDLFRGDDEGVALSFKTEGSGSTIHPVEYTEIDVSRVPPGAYVLQVTVTDEGTGASTARALPIAMIGE